MEVNTYVGEMCQALITDIARTDDLNHSHNIRRFLITKTYIVAHHI